MIFSVRDCRFVVALVSISLSKFRMEGVLILETMDRKADIHRLLSIQVAFRIMIVLEQ